MTSKHAAYPVKKGEVGYAAASDNFLFFLPFSLIRFDTTFL